MDDADRAHENMEIQMARALANTGPVPTGPGAVECDECGDRMPPQRTGYGYRLCVDCQSQRERKGL